MRGTFAGVGLLATLTAITAAPPPANGADACGAPPAPSGTQSFGYTGAEETWLVPPGVSWIRVTALGGRGGQESHSELGGAGGGVTTTVRVDPGACLAVYVGGDGAGHGGFGWAQGGDHGYVTGGGDGYSGGGGGGASAVIGGWGAVVGAGAGGGGGAGGKIVGSTGTPGGPGGNGGPDPTPAGGDAPDGGGSGGCGGCELGAEGAPGQDAGAGTQFAGAGAGGGGGAGWSGGGGGDHGDAGEGSGGGGGGGGESYAGSGTGATTFFDQVFPDGNGSVTITWPADPPAASAHAGGATDAPRELLVSRTGTVDLPVTCARATACAGVALVRGRGSRAVLARARYRAAAGGPSTVVVRLTRRGRLALRRDVLVPARVRLTGGARTHAPGVVLLGRRAPATTVTDRRAAAGVDRRVRLTLACPERAAGGCRGSVRLRSESGRGPVSSTSPFRLRAGRTRAVTLRLTAGAAARLAHRGRLAAVAVTTTTMPAAKPTQRVHDLTVSRASRNSRP